MGRGGGEEGSASSQRGTIGARVMRRPPTKRSWYAHSALPTVPFARRTTYMLPLYVPRRPANKPLPLIDALRFFRDRQRDRRMRERAKVFSRLPVSFARYSLSLSLFLRSVEKERKKKKSRSKFRKVWILVGYLLVIIVITVDDYIVSGITVSFINYISCL